MAFDVYNLIQSKEVREYLRKHRKFKVLEQEVIIRNSYYTIEQKLEFMKQFLSETKEEANAKEELELLEERVRMYEFIVRFIHNPGNNVIYMAQEETCGYNICREDNGIRNFGIDDKWFEKKGFSKECVEDIGNEFYCPLPFEHESRIKLQTPEMLKPVYGILDSSEDCYGQWHHFLCVEDEEYDFHAVRKLMKENKIWVEYNNRQIDVIDLSYPQLDMYDKFLTYDWIERADEVEEQVTR